MAVWLSLLSVKLEAKYITNKLIQIIKRKPKVNLKKVLSKYFIHINIYHIQTNKHVDKTKPHCSRATGFCEHSPLAEASRVRKCSKGLWEAYSGCNPFCLTSHKGSGKTAPVKLGDTYRIKTGSKCISTCFSTQDLEGDRYASFITF